MFLEVIIAPDYTEKAIELFKRIIELFPDTRRAESAEYYIQEMGGETGSTDASAAPQGEIYEKYHDRLVYSIPYDTEYSTQPVPIGIDVSDSILMTRYLIYENSCVYAIGSYTRNLDAAVKFLDWILEGRTGPVDSSTLEAETAQAD